MFIKEDDSTKNEMAESTESTTSTKSSPDESYSPKNELKIENNDYTSINGYNNSN
jgi:hypothetical protein